MEKGTIIKSVKQLPEWFDLKKYEKVKYFNAGEWYDELITRFFIMTGKNEFVNDSLSFFERWELIQQDGLLFYSGQRQKISHRLLLNCPQMQVLKESASKTNFLEHEFLTISSLANLYVFMTIWLLELPEREKMVERIRELFKDDDSSIPMKPMGGEAANWMAKPFEDFPSDVVMGFKNKFAYARVKLDASDEQIKKDFALWLAYERKRRDCPAPKKNFSEIELTSWYESAVLPYLDLMIWSTITKTKIKKYILAQAIYSDAYSVESDSDPLGKLKTTKKKAEFLMSYNAMKLLELQIID